MNDKDVKKIRGVVKEEIGSALKPINDRLGKVESKIGKVGVKFGKVGKKLDTLWEQVEKVTFGLNDVQETLDAHTVVLKRIETKGDNDSDDIHKLDKRVITLENTAGIVPPPELTI